MLLLFLSPFINSGASVRGRTSSVGERERERERENDLEEAVTAHTMYTQVIKALMPYHKLTKRLAVLN